MTEHGDNHPPEATDHDHIVEAMTRLARIESDVTIYRDRYHDVVAPGIQRLTAQVADIAKQIYAMGERIAVGENAKAEIADHKDECTRYNRSNEGRLVTIEAKIDKNQQSLAELVDRKAEVLAQKISDNAKERHEGQRSIIKWVAGLIFAGMAGLLGALWTMLAPHIIH